MIEKNKKVRNRASYTMYGVFIMPSHQGLKGIYKKKKRRRSQFSKENYKRVDNLKKGQLIYYSTNHSIK
ncbi:hypothetical protein BUY85_00970 [Staphylococcus equorum]|nr:hypothetical protein AST04_12945 [Staphylococcus equorum]PTE82248.1 hypothetical protein BUY85_00495 [Staphylococcus equorum]PTE82342.1 hypothetical protein BUY85_00970 [Staphylococcus equorum]